MTNLISVADFKRQAKAGQKPDGGVYRLSTVASVPVDGDDRTRRFCFSDASVDRMGDTIAADGWVLDDFLRNPVALWAHDSSALPIGRASNLAVEDGRLMGDITFISGEIYPFAETVFQMVQGGWLNAVSVGFLPIEHDWSNEDDRPWGIDFKTQSLLEISICPVPANPNALAEAAAKGIDVRPLKAWAKRLLNETGRQHVRRTETAQRRQAKESPTMPKPRLRSDDPSANEADPTAGGATIGNCGRSAELECGMVDPSECSVHGDSASANNESKDFRAAVRLAVRSELRKLRGSSAKRLRRRDATDGDGDSDLPPGHEDLIHVAAANFRSAEDYYDSGDDHHDEGLELVDQASKDLNATGEVPPDHAETVRTALARFKSAEALYSLGDEAHDKGMDLLSKAVRALDGDEDPAPGAGENDPAEQEKILAELRTLRTSRR